MASRWARRPSALVTATVAVCLSLAGEARGQRPTTPAPLDWLGGHWIQPPLERQLPIGLARMEATFKPIDGGFQGLLEEARVDLERTTISAYTIVKKGAHLTLRLVENGQSYRLEGDASPRHLRFDRSHSNHGIVAVELSIVGELLVITHFFGPVHGAAVRQTYRLAPDR
jgi:hypothetical protein